MLHLLQQQVHGSLLCFVVFGQFKTWAPSTVVRCVTVVRYRTVLEILLERWYGEYGQGLQVFIQLIETSAWLFAAAGLLGQCGWRGPAPRGG